MCKRTAPLVSQLRVLPRRTLRKLLCPISIYWLIFERLSAERLWKQRVRPCNAIVVHYFTAYTHLQTPLCCVLVTNSVTTSWPSWVCVWRTRRVVVSSRWSGGRPS